MAIPTVPSWSFQDPVTSEKLQQMCDAITFLMGGGSAGKPSCKLSASGVQSIPNNVATALSFDQELLDPRGMHVGGSPTQIKPVESGLYIVGAQCSVLANTTGNRELFLRANGSDEEPGERISAVDLDTRALQVTTVLFANGTTDYFEAMVVQNSGGALNTALDRFAPRFWAVHASLVSGF